MSTTVSSLSNSVEQAVMPVSWPALGLVQATKSNAQQQRRCSFQELFVVCSCLSADYFAFLDFCSFSDFHFPSPVFPFPFSQVVYLFCL